MPRLPCTSQASVCAACAPALSRSKARSKTNSSILSTRTSASVFVPVSPSLFNGSVYRTTADSLVNSFDPGLSNWPAYYPNYRSAFTAQRTSFRSSAFSTIPRGKESFGCREKWNTSSLGRKRKRSSPRAQVPRNLVTNSDLANAHYHRNQVLWKLHIA